MFRLTDLMLVLREPFCFLTFHQFVHFDLSIVAVMGNIVTSNYLLDTKTYNKGGNYYSLQKFLLRFV